MAFTSSDLAAVEAAIAKGELSVQFSDRRVQYRSMDELLKAREVIKQDIASAGGTSPTTRCTYGTFYKD